MTTVDAATAAEEHELSIDEMEAGIKANPNDMKLKEGLVDAIYERYVYGRADADAGDKKDLKRLRTLIKELPEPMAALHRAYISYVDKQYDEAVDWLSVRVSAFAEKGDCFTGDELYGDLVYPFGDAKPEFWKKLSESFDRIFPDSAAAYFLQGFASAYDTEDADTQASCYKQALDKDQSYWMAAWKLGDIYRNEKNWQSAKMYYEKALQSEWPKDFPILYFNYSWCLGKLKLYVEEETQIRAGLNLEPEFDNARNNLGWSLYKQGKYQEALPIFDELIKFGADGKNPFHNKARCLKALKRYDEAIDAWRAVNPSGKLPAWITTEIFNLQKLINKQAFHQERAQQATEEPVEEAIGHEDAEVPADEDGATAPEEIEVRSDKNLVKPKRSLGARTAASKEVLLEESIEQMMKDGQSVFGRKLKMYESPDGMYGRQFIIPGHGRIDLLAEDTESGEIVVIELKKDESHDIVVGQISMYLAWVRENLAKENQNVIGLICVFSVSPKLRLAAKSIPGLELFEYGMQFAKV
jgi:tetratricopeptide (TPR) repeat protein/RecB family endonuclease NucS